MQPLTKKSRQAIKKAILILILFEGFFLQNVFSQEQKSKIDYSIKSNILDPDTLKMSSLEYKVFWHFVDWNFKRVDEIPILTLKSEFEKIGITTKDKEFDTAYFFFKDYIVFHKEQVELWVTHFQELSPTKKE